MDFLALCIRKREVFIASHEKIGIRKLFIIQVVLSFVVIAVLIVLGGILVGSSIRKYDAE